MANTCAATTADQVPRQRHRASRARSHAAGPPNDRAPNTRPFTAPRLRRGRSPRQAPVLCRPVRTPRPARPRRSASRPPTVVKMPTCTASDTTAPNISAARGGRVFAEFAESQWRGGGAERPHDEAGERRADDDAAACRRVWTRLREAPQDGRTPPARSAEPETRTPATGRARRSRPPATPACRASAGRRQPSRRRTPTRRCGLARFPFGQQRQRR